jgi:hypothetical protein
MVCIVSRHASLVQHHWAWFVLFDYELHGWREKTQSMPNKDEQVKHDVKQPNPCLVMKSKWRMKWKNTNHTK